MRALQKVKIGVIGPSWWVNYWHLPAIENHPAAELVAVCGATAREDSAVHAKYGDAARSYTDIERMLDGESLDGVVVCTPNYLHHSATMAAFRHGLHVTCEKPVALNAAQAREMADTAREKHLLGMCNFPYRANPAVVQMRAMIADGWLGSPLTISGSYNGGFGLGRGPNWRASREKSGAGILGDLGSHLIDLARFVTREEFKAVTAHTMTTLWNEDGSPNLVRSEDPRVGDRNDDSCAFLAELGNGVQGIFHTSWVAYQGALTQHQELEVYGSRGRLHFLATHSGTMLRGMQFGTKRWEQFEVSDTVPPAPDHEEDEDYFRPGRNNAVNNTYRWIEAIRTGETSISPDLEDGWRSQLVVDAVIKASAERRWVDVLG